MPVVLLSSEEKTTTNYGDVAAPVLTIVDWSHSATVQHRPACPCHHRHCHRSMNLLPPSKETKMLGEAMDDEIPY